MIQMKLENTICLELVQIAIWNKQPNLDILNSLTSEDWAKISEFSNKQGVYAIVFDGAMKLPINMQPPRNQKLTWLVNVNSIEDRFDRYLNSCAELVKLYAQDNIKVMLLKGIGLAYQYPVPRHREGGDIDIWLFGNYKRGNELIEKQGLELFHEGEKHISFYFQNIPIENHSRFLASNLSAVDKELEDSLEEILKRESCDIAALPQDTSVFTPSPTFNAIFLGRHMIKHMIDGASIRHLCDWSIFLEKYYGKYDQKYIINAFNKAGMLELITALSNICVKHIGLPKCYNPFEDMDTEKLESKLFAAIIYKKEKLQSSNTLKIFFYKCSKFYNSIWKKELVEKRSKYEIVLKAIKNFVLNPSRLFNK